MTTYIFTDGASKGNPGKGGYGAVILSGDVVRELGGREDHTTNNRMELSAALVAVREVSSDEEAVLFSDSSYVIQGITKWIFGWEKNNWKTKTGDVLNRDLWEKLRDATRGKTLIWTYVPGHSLVAGNERANDIAEDFARGKDVSLFSGNTDEYGRELIRDGKPLSESGEVSNLEKKQKNARAYSYVSVVDGVVRTHKTWNDCERHVKGKMARFKKALSKEDEEKIVKDFSSSR